MPRRPTPIQIGMAVLALVAGAGASSEMHREPETKRPNIVFFLVDDQTASVLGCYGDPLARTPNIDRLAARGVRFSNAFVSQSICWVSRTTLLTGVTGRGYGSPGDPELTRPEIARELTSDHLRSAGYRTGFFGKWHAKMPAGYKPSDHFDEFEAIHRDPYWKRLPDGSLRHETDLIVDRGLEFLGRRDRDRPFALHLWFNACHAEDGDRRPAVGHFPWPESASGLFVDTVMPRPRIDDPAVFDVLPEFLRTSIPRERWFWRWNTEWKYQQNMRAYYRMVAGIDHAIGRLVSELERQGLLDNTIIVYSADNGYHMGNRGLTGKWSHFEESLRVPLIIVDPRLPAPRRGRVVDDSVLNLDLAPTFLEWAGRPAPPHYQGRSLVELVEDRPEAPRRTETFHEHFAVRSRIAAWEGVRTPEFKYARYFDHGDFEFLYDLKADPHETNNLAKSPDHSAQLERMRLRTKELAAKLGPTLPPPRGAFIASTEPHPKASAAVTVKPGPDGFVRLFNGRNLNGWAGDPAYWSVEDGAITGKTDGTLKSNRFLSWTGSTIRNFELVAQVRISSGGNSGIQYRGLPRPEVGLDIVSGYQCDVVANNPNYNGMLYEERGRRILSHTGEKVIVASDGRPWIVGQMPVQTFKADEWHEYRVVVEGNHHRHWIDGIPTADLVDLDERGRALEGVLAVQVHVGPAMKVQYRDFRIRHLPDDLPLIDAKDRPIPRGSLGVRPQGKLPPDWKPPVYDTP